MDIILKARIGGYTWALQQDKDAPYDEMASNRAWFDACIKGTELEADPENEIWRIELWHFWEVGVKDARWLIDDHGGEMLSVFDIEQRTNFDRSYIKAEIKRGNLKAQKVGKQYVIFPSNFRAWMNNPKRGSRSKSDGAG